MSRNLNNGLEYEYEAQLGLPQALPKNETILWQGSPDFWTIAKDIYFIRVVALYFLFLLSVNLFEGLEAGDSARTISLSLLWMFSLSMLGIGFLAVLALCVAKTAVYTITDRRIVMRIGVVLTMTFNLPFKAIESADVLKVKKGIGSIAIKVEESSKIAIFHLWPHCRAWKINHPEPLLLGIIEVEKVAQILTQAWRHNNDSVNGAAAIQSSPHLDNNLPENVSVRAAHIAPTSSGLIPSTTKDYANI